MNFSGGLLWMMGKPVLFIAPNLIASFGELLLSRQASYFPVVQITICTSFHLLFLRPNLTPVCFWIIPIQKYLPLNHQLFSILISFLFSSCSASILMVVINWTLAFQKLVEMPILFEPIKLKVIQVLFKDLHRPYHN